VCNKLHHPAIIPEQGASKIVKISQQMAKLCRKLKWLVFSGTRCISRISDVPSDNWLCECCHLQSGNEKSKRRQYNKTQKINLIWLTIKLLFQAADNHTQESGKMA